MRRASGEGGIGHVALDYEWVLARLDDLVLLKPEAYKKQMHYSIQTLATWDYIIDIVHAEFMPIPFTFSSSGTAWRRERTSPREGRGTAGPDR